MRGKKCKRKNLLGGSERRKKVALVSGKTHFSYLSAPADLVVLRLSFHF